MRHKRLRLSAIFFLGLGLTSLQAQIMYVKASSGTQTAYDLINLRKMTFAAGNVTVQKTNNITGVYALSGLKYLSFKDYTTGIDELPQLENATLIAYPNPVGDVLNIDLTGTNIVGTISILSLDGKVMQQQKNNGASTVTINLSQLPQGIYICRYVSTTEIKTVKIIKQ